MSEKMTHINSDIIKWAREQSGFEVDEVESKGNFKNIRLWECGEDYPTYTQLKDLAELYRKPVVVFFFPEPPKMKNIAATCRTLPRDSYLSLSKDIIHMIDSARVMQLNLTELYEGINPSKIKIMDFSFKKYNLTEISEEIRDLMNADLKIQKKISKPEEAFEYWRDCFYQLGIFVFKDAFKDDKVSGFCLFDKEFPVIYINNSLSMNRQIFTLFHEIYHIISKTSGFDFLDDNELVSYSNTSNYEIEINCNAFAGEFLVPNKDFEKELKSRDINDSLIESLSRKYSVSREVIARKLLDKRKISQVYYDSRRQQFNQDYFRFSLINKEEKKTKGNYYYTQLAYKGKHYTEIAFHNFYANKISVGQLSQYMNMKIQSVRKVAALKGWGSL